MLHRNSIGKNVMFVSILHDHLREELGTVSKRVTFKVSIDWRSPLSGNSICRGKVACRKSFNGGLLRPDCKGIWEVYRMNGQHQVDSWPVKCGAEGAYQKDSGMSLVCTTLWPGTGGEDEEFGFRHTKFEVFLGHQAWIVGHMETES